MQAQSPSAPYVGLWSRLDSFAADDLYSLIEERLAVRGTSLRKTLYLHTAADYLAIRPLVQGVLDAEARRNSTFGKDLVAGLDVRAVAAAGRELMSQRPRTGVELRALLGTRWPDRDPFALWHIAVCVLPLVQVPPRGLWGRGGQVTLLSHDNRARIVPEHLQARVHRSLGKPMFLVDGFVAGTWKLIRVRPVPGRCAGMGRTWSENCRFVHIARLALTCRNGEFERTGRAGHLLRAVDAAARGRGLPAH